MVTCVPEHFVADKGCTGGVLTSSRTLLRVVLPDTSARPDSEASMTRTSAFVSGPLAPVKSPHPCRLHVAACLTRRRRMTMCPILPPHATASVRSAWGLPARAASAERDVTPARFSEAKSSPCKDTMASNCSSSSIPHYACATARLMIGCQKRWSWAFTPLFSPT